MTASCHGPFRAPARWLNRPLALFLSASVAAAGLTACGAGRNVLGTNTSPCFVALPIATRAVHARGSLAGVRLVDTARLGAGGRFMRDLLGMLPTSPPRELCVVAYVGSFTPDQVEMPAGLPPAGIAERYAIVLVTVTKPRLLGTFVIQHEPIAFAHRHVSI
jgi:hypothetical protein